MKADRCKSGSDPFQKKAEEIANGYSSCMSEANVTRLAKFIAQALEETYLRGWNDGLAQDHEEYIRACKKVEKIMRKGEK